MVIVSPVRIGLWDPFQMAFYLTAKKRWISVILIVLTFVGSFSVCITNQRLVSISHGKHVSLVTVPRNGAFRIVRKSAGTSKTFGVWNWRLGENGVKWWHRWHQWPEGRGLLFNSLLLPCEPTTFIFRGYNPYIGGLNPSFFHGFGVQRYIVGAQFGEKTW